MAKQKSNIINEYHLNQHEPQKPQLAIYDLNAYLNKNQANTTKPHIHSYYQIIWFQSGKGKHFVDFKEYDVFSDAIFFIAKNQVHYFDHGTKYKGVMLHFNEAFLRKDDDVADNFLVSNLFNNPYQQPSCCVGNSINTLLQEYIQQIKDELQNEEPFGKEELLRAYLKAFLIQVQRGKARFEKANPDTPLLFDERRVQLTRFTNLIDQHYNKGLSVAEYADLMHISLRTLSNLTSQLLNKTPSLMIQERIILEAKRLLLYSNLNINQVGYRLGFDDPSYFVKYFKKHTNISPSEFRKSVS
jgi:AraC family transcriptional regulator, transcriptional activator of pobA